MYDCILSSACGIYNYCPCLLSSTASAMSAAFILLCQLFSYYCVWCLTMSSPCMCLLSSTMSAMSDALMLLMSAVATVLHCLCQVSCLHTTMSATSFTFVGCRNELRTSGLVSLVTNWGFREVNFLPRNLFPIRKEEHHMMRPVMSDPPIPNLQSVHP